MHSVQRYILIHRVLPLKSRKVQFLSFLIQCRTEKFSFKFRQIPQNRGRIRGRLGTRHRKRKCVIIVQFREYVSIEGRQMARSADCSNITQIVELFVWFRTRPLTLFLLIHECHRKIFNYVRCATQIIFIKSNVLFCIILIYHMSSCSDVVIRNN